MQHLYMARPPSPRTKKRGCTAPRMQHACSKTVSAYRASATCQPEHDKPNIHCIPGASMPGARTHTSTPQVSPSSPATRAKKTFMPYISSAAVVGCRDKYVHVTRSSSPCWFPNPNPCNEFNGSCSPVTAMLSLLVSFSRVHLQ